MAYLAVGSMAKRLSAAEGNVLISIAGQRQGGPTAQLRAALTVSNPKSLYARTMQAQLATMRIVDKSLLPVSESAIVGHALDGWLRSGRRALRRNVDRTVRSQGLYTAELATTPFLEKRMLQIISASDSQIL